MKFFDIEVSDKLALIAALGIGGLAGWFGPMAFDRDGFGRIENFDPNDPRQESVLGGVTVTISTEPATPIIKITSLEKSPIGASTKSLHIAFDTSSDLFGASGKTLVIGDGWPSSNGWPVTIAAKEEPVIATMVYATSAGQTTRTLTLPITGGATATYVFSGSSTPDPEAPILALVGSGGGSAATLRVTFEGHADEIPLLLKDPPR